MSRSGLSIGSRGSPLALWQAGYVKSLLEARGLDVVIEVIKTTGDRVTSSPGPSQSPPHGDVPLAKGGLKGLFTKEIEDALLAGRVQLAVHSLKDLPTELPTGLMLAAVPRREDPRDALVARKVSSFAALPAAARVGTGSLRRAAQLRALRPDLEVLPLRGNLDTRLRKLDDQKLDAIVLAVAGLKRLGLADRITQIFEPDLMCPAAGQGALGVEVRADDLAMIALLAPLDDRDARRATAAERALLAALGGGCQVPIGAFARAKVSPTERTGRSGALLSVPENAAAAGRCARFPEADGSDAGSLSLDAVVATPDGSRLLRASGDGDDPEELGARVARQLLLDGARRILDHVYGRAVPVAESP